MKKIFIILGTIGIVLSLGLTGTAFATHDPTYNHPTPIPDPQPEPKEPEPPTISDEQEHENSESLNKKWGELYLESQLLKESFSDYPNNMTTIERMAEIFDETKRIATILSEREFTIDVPGMSIRNVTFDDPVEPDCGPNTLLTDGLCVVIDGGCEPDINGDTIWCGPIHDNLQIILSVPFVFGISSLIAGIVIGVIIWRNRK